MHASTKVSLLIASTLIVATLIVPQTDRSYAAGTTPTRVSDVSLAPPSTQFGGFFNLNGTLIFSADTINIARGLYRSDGTTNGTQLIEPAINSEARSGLLPSRFVTLGNTAYFAASGFFNGEITGDELWRTDGSKTELVKDIALGDADSLPSDLVSFNGKLYFAADDSTNGIELWVSDGTAAGTSLLRDINPGPNSSLPFGMTVVSNTLYFAANDGQTGIELWRSDGTAAGTIRVTDQNPGAGDFMPLFLTAIGNTLYFSADNGQSGRELWRSDAGGTSLVRDINPAANSSYPSDWVVVGSTLYFSADDGQSGFELWRSDGTPGGTARIADIAPGSTSSFPYSLTPVGNTIYFSANNGTNGFEPFIYNTAAAVPQQLADLNPGAADSFPDQLTVTTGGKVFFSADDGSNGRELWVTSGSQSTTTRIDLVPGPTGSDPSNLTLVGGNIFLSAFSNTAGFELWRVDTATNSTTLVKDLTTTILIDSGPSNITELSSGRYLFSVSQSGIGRELWISDGTLASTRLVRDINPGEADSWPTELVRLGNSVLFSADDGTGRELFISDGTSDGTFQLKDINPDGASDPYNLTVIGNKVYFAADDGSSGRELWESDGTIGGTRRSADINPGASSSNPYGLTRFASGLIFAASSDAIGTELFLFHAQTGAVTSVDIATGAGSDSFPFEFTVAGGLAFFGASDNTRGNELWVSDGTIAGTRLVRDINQTVTEGTANSSLPFNFEPVGSSVYFSADDGVNGRELWISDGTTTNTKLVRDINTVRSNGEPGSSSPFDMTNIGGTVYFSADDGTNGTELWRSNGSTDSTQLVRDINPGPSRSEPNNLVNGNGTLYFSANNGNGFELWRSTGSAEGTERVAQINPKSGSNPLSLTVANSVLLFSATEESRGSELWRLDILPNQTVAYLPLAVRPVAPPTATATSLPTQTPRPQDPTPTPRPPTATPTNQPTATPITLLSLQPQDGTVKQVTAGRNVQYRLRLVNVGQSIVTVDLRVNQSCAQQITGCREGFSLPISQINTFTPGQFIDFVVNIDVPGNTANGITGRTVVDAQVGGQVVSSVTLTSQVRSAPQPTAEPDDKPKVRARLSGPTTAQINKLFTIEMRLENQGDASASQTDMTITYDSNKLELRDSDLVSGDWVTSNKAGEVKVRFGKLESRKSRIGRLVFYVKANVATDTSFSLRGRYSRDGNGGSLDDTNTLTIRAVR